MHSLPLVTETNTRLNLVELALFLRDCQCLLANFTATRLRSFMDSTAELTQRKS